MIADSEHFMILFVVLNEKLPLRTTNTGRDVFPFQLVSFQDTFQHPTANTAETGNHSLSASIASPLPTMQRFSRQFKYGLNLKVNQQSSILMKSMVQKRALSDLSGAVVELSNYLEQRISLKTEEFAKV
jgi:hypothetical protein